MFTLPFRATYCSRQLAPPPHVHKMHIDFGLSRAFFFAPLGGHSDPRLIQRSPRRMAIRCSSAAHSRVLFLSPTWGRSDFPANLGPPFATKSLGAAPMAELHDRGAERRRLFISHPFGCLVGRKSRCIDPPYMPGSFGAGRTV